MSKVARKSAAFHGAITFALHFAVALAAGLLVVYIAPGLDYEKQGRSLFLSFSSTLTPVVLVFSICVLAAFAILCWRAWHLYLGPWWRRSNGA